MKSLFLLTLPFLFLSCAGSNPDPEEEPDPKEKPETPDVETPPELPVDDPNDPLRFVDPVTTNKLMGEEDKKTVTGPAEVTPPEPAPDSAIDVKPPAIPVE